MTEDTSPLEPRLVTSGKIQDKLHIDSAVIGQTMLEMGIGTDTIQNTSVFIDDKNRLATNGIAYPKTLGRLRHITNPDLRNTRGPIVRISSIVKSSERTTDDMNQTLVHELEHVAQMERKDTKMKIGHVVIWGLATMGGMTANRLTRNQTRTTQNMASILGAAVGQQIGYKLAPHEVQAKKRAVSTKTAAIGRKQI